MDEPLSNLDAKLRVQMRAELKRFHRDLGATVVYVTHDQLEAVTMADKMAVMNGGVLQQYDRPEHVFANPINTFVAGFVGSPSMNLLSANVLGAADGAFVESPDGWRLDLSARNARRVAAATSRSVIIGARHSTIGLAKGLLPPGAVQGLVYAVEPTGDITFVHIRLGSAMLVVSVAPDFRLSPDEPVGLMFDQERLHFFDGPSGQALPVV